MAIDGSFSLHSAVERFLDRFPKLQSFPEFYSLSRKGQLFTEEDVVNNFVGVFLHPSYTIPMMGCFCPIARKFTDKAIDLLRLVPNLSKHGRGLDLHELACLAFCRALDMAPFLLSSVLNYFKFAPPPFQRFSVKQAIPSMWDKIGTHELLVARISYRFLIMKSEVFLKLWDWSCFVDLLEEPTGTSECVTAEATDLIWCGVQITTIVLKLTYTASENLNIRSEEAYQCLLRWEEFCHDTSIEKAGLYYMPVVQHTPGSSDRSMDFSQENCLKPFGLDFQSVSLPKMLGLEQPLKNQKLATWDDKSKSDTFILTSKVKKSFERVLLAVSQKWPVLLYGPRGSGKSSLIAKLARDSNNRVLSIQMDDQIDGRTLVGSYVCTDIPGEFRWQPGSLTQAVQNGFWVVFEDIDRAPADVHSVLTPLLEGAGSFMIGNGEEIRVAEGFRMFSTVATSKLEIYQGAGRGSPSVLWRSVMVRPPEKEDLKNIVLIWYPKLDLLVDRLIETFVRVNSTYMHQIAGSHSGNSASVGLLNRFSLRDLLKWCKRLVGLCFSYDGGCLSEYQCYLVYKEAVDVFAAFSTSPKHRLSIMKEIARLWAVPVSAADTLYPRDKPIIKDFVSDLRIGRVSLQYTTKTLQEPMRPFVEINSSLHVLERIACSVKYNEAVLLVGETGTGKTTLVQNLASRLGQKLTVLNLSQQSDVADIIGGFKPINEQFVYMLLHNEFIDLLSRTFSVKKNKKFVKWLEKHRSYKNWNMLLEGFRSGVDKFRESVEVERTGSSKNRKRQRWDEENIRDWERFSVKLERVSHSDASLGMMFSFVEGSFITAIRNGEWILLDEVNLAPPETLQRIIGVLEGENGALCLAERGDIEYIHCHSNFRMFACMNPATDTGKRDLPFSLRSRFTEYYVDDVLEDEDLSIFINQFISDGHKDQKLVNKIVCFYKTSKEEAEERLLDGADQKPQYSLRSLYRALEYTRKAERKFGFYKALYDGFCMFFLTLLVGPSVEIMKKKILSLLLNSSVPPPHVPFDQYLTSIKSDASLGSYVLTKSVREHLENLARALLIKRYPVLLQGPTSSGKTSLVRYLAALTDHEFVRINNHEHTDLQEYLGSYITDASGKLVFNEGVLVKAVRNGYWIVLDELNLAPSDVLEALNRLLDDNRELFVPELQETIKAHPNFMLFATQNPPTGYAGRKMLSRAFRNRFIEIHVGEIPYDELSTILEKRCEIPQSYAGKMVEVMKELQSHRHTHRSYDGKHGFITPRDLFRWADRYKKFGKSYEDLAKDGYYLLAERLRDESERSLVQQVLEKHLRVKLNINSIYDQAIFDGKHSFNLCVDSGGSKSLESFNLTKSMRRLYFLVERCYQLREPVLLVGETGGGKTTVCQLLSACLQMKLHILNCHQNTETSDFIGGFGPIRERSRLISNYKEKVENLKKLKAYTCLPQDLCVSPDIGRASSTLDLLNCVIRKYKDGQVCYPDVTTDDLYAFEQLKLDLDELHHNWQSIFVWHDGPIVKAMRDGDLFLADEISLANDSVLERLNSVLEPERKLSLAEKGGNELEEVSAHPNFFVLATMNPGGDYGKTELSPALRNRFTEIWVPPVSDLDELREIALARISELEDASNSFPSDGHKLSSSVIVDAMICFYEWFNQLPSDQLPSERLLTVRDLISWVAFFNVTGGSLGPEYAVLHGLFLVLLDGLSLGTAILKAEADKIREICLSFLLHKLRVDEGHLLYSKLSRMENYSWGECGSLVGVSHNDDVQQENVFGIDPFFIRKGCFCCEIGGFEFKAPTTRRNALRVLRAMQLPKPVLLEGSPGVGKTSLIVALGKFSGHKVVRINFSEQTDMMDLLGSDLPVESDEGMKFSWSDGILLQALKEGSWVLLDELNLAPPAVLEGLNAILDHRAEVFIPELGHTYKCPPSFRVFACQNPWHQGCGRKGLPRSFLNRFTKVYVDELVADDYLSICESKFPTIPRSLLSKLILFNERMHEEILANCKFAKDGSPWEFNLRDVFRSCEIIEGSPKHRSKYSFLNIVYIQRMRTKADRHVVLRLFKEVFEVTPLINPFPRIEIKSNNLIVGHAAIKRNHVQLSTSLSCQLHMLPEIRQSLEAAAHCVQHQWLCILIGPPCSGKSSLIRLLANLTGNVLNEVNISSAADISELLGSFEQYDALRTFHSVVSQAERYINEYCSLLAETSKAEFISKKHLVTRWLAFLPSMKFDSMDGSASICVEKWEKIVCSLGLLIELIEELKLNIEKKSPNVSYSIMEVDLFLKKILKLKVDHQKRLTPRKFEWVPGILIKAIELGEWIVLDNANLCNPTVLDRINSLVESSGSITVNERGIVDGNPLVIHPHPNFRMFITINPTGGEVSRAMRNRGVEIFMMPPYWVLDNVSGCKDDDTEFEDVKRFLILSGIPGSQLVNAIAKAHIFAKNEGLHLNVHITYLELSRWVHLFQQLLMKGHSPISSLQISWDHVYLSSFGEVEGGKIINFALTTYLSASDISGNDTLAARTLCLPGGWPVPLILRDFMHYSREASVKQNCMYLEFLGAQLASHQYRFAPNRFTKDHWLYLMDKMTLHEILFPKVPKVIVSDCRNEAEFDLKLANKMLLFAAYWAIEQATESDFNLYYLRLSWFSSQVHPFCQFFQEFVRLLEQMVKHPLWQYILHCRRQLGLDWQSMPFLSLELLDLAESNSTCKYLSNSISCIDLLKLTYRQWEIEKQWEIKNKHHFDEGVYSFTSFLESLQQLENEFLSKLACRPTLIVECSSFNNLTELYYDIIENHALFWHQLILSKFDHLIISWRSLVKDARKLLDICPERVEELVMKSRELEKVFSKKRRNLDLFSFSEKSLLWVYGGHPYLPPSCDLHHKHDQLLKFVELLWSTKKASRNQEMLSSQLIELVASCDYDFRSLVVQGVSMSLFIMKKWSQEALHDDDIVLQLEEMYQMLVRRFEYVKHKLKMNTGSNGPADWGESSVACCSFPPGMLFPQSAFCSWQDTLPPVDNASLHWDMELLQELTSFDSSDIEGLYQAVGRVSDLLNSALNFSLAFSSRPLQMFLPHQKILLMLNAWTQVDAVNVKVASFVLELWFRWHQSLWMCFPEHVKNFSNIDGLDTIDTALPHPLIEPVNASTVWQISRSMHTIREFRLQCLKFRVTSSNIWRNFSHRGHLPNFLLSAARSLVQQIMYAHKKSFSMAQFSALKSLFCSFQNSMVTEEMIEALTALLASTRHHKLKDLVHEFIAPLLSDLYIRSNAAGEGFNSNIGSVWIRIGGLRFRLLLSCMDIDPAMKYYCKYSQLAETISSLELEIQVRKECQYLAGQLLTGEADKRKEKRLEQFKEELRKLQKKMVYRSEAWKYMKLMDECADFLKLISSLESMVSSVEDEKFQLAVNQACNWQETASRFIDRLTDEYSAFDDIIQPIQVAAFEMKLGLSLILSSALENEYLSRVGLDNINFVMETIYNLMRFPRGALNKLISVKYNSSLYMLPSYRIDSGTGFYSVDTGMLERLVTLSSGIAAYKKVSVMHYRAAAWHNILVQIAHSASNSKVLDDESYLLLDKIFDKFARLWMSMKVQAKSKSDYDSQQYKFKPRVFQIESVIEVDISSLSNSFTTETFSEWKDFFAEEISTDKMEATEACETSVEEWKQLEESILSSVVHIHNKLFGSADLVQTPGTFEVYDEDRLLSFCDSYTLGVDLIRGVRTPLLSSLDAKLMPEHLLYLCLDYERKFLSFHRSAKRYNFYKDSYASEMAKMVEALAPLQQRISSLNELQDHNDVWKISSIIDMLLSLPSVTPLAKTFSGMQFLLHKAQAMQESGSKFCFSRELEPVFQLLSSWKTLELESWPGLLDEVMDQYESNAGKLWFPLYSVLRPSSSDQSVVQSLEDFIHTSSIGEYRKRLQLLFAFLGQNHIGASLKENYCPWWMEHSKYLYNIFGFYAQFLPIVMNYISMNKKEIEAELKALVKLCQWDCTKSYLSIENLKKSRQKLRKLVQKFSDILQEPVVMFLNQEASQKRAITQCFHGHKFISDVLNKGSFCGDFDMTYFSDENRSKWFGECNKKLDTSLQNFNIKKKEVFGILSPHWKNFEESGSTSRPCAGSQHANLSYGERWKAIWDVIENIYITAAECGQLWKEESKSQGKRRALSSLLKLLESSGLSRHKSTYWEDHQKPWWFLQHSGDMQHLLQTNSELPCVISETAAGVQKNEVLEESSVMEWKTATELYFKSVVSVLRLQQICLNPHKDITYEQVDRSGSFLRQLVQVQQNQLAAANDFDQQLKRLRECTSSLKKLCSLCTSNDNSTVLECFIPEQVAAFKCLWQQKQIFDSLYAISQEAMLLLRTYEKSHSSTCRSVRPSVSDLIAAIENFLPVFSRSKESLDYYLIGGTKAITPVTSTSHFLFVTEELEQLVSENFNVMKDFKENFLVSQKLDLDRSSVREVLIDRFQEIIEKATLVQEEFTSAFKANYVLEDLSEKGSFCERKPRVPNAGFDEALSSTYGHIAEVLQKLCSSSTILMAEESVNITSWKLLFVDFVDNLRLDVLCERVFKTVAFGEKPANHSDDKIYSYCYTVGNHNRDLFILMDLILNFGDELLKNFLAMHRSVSVTTHVLANVLAALYSKGFGTATEQLEDDGTVNASENATGTGMGEGIGSKDVSDQITDEDQLLGTRGQSDNQDDSSEVPSKNDRGIEMEQDFQADAVSISEDSGEDESTDAENEQLESEMGPTGPNSDAVRERTWDKNEDEALNGTDEKHESGPSIRERDRSSRELRAKDDFGIDESGKADYGELDDQNNETGSQDDIGDGETTDEINLEKEAAVDDPNGKQPDEVEQTSDVDMDMDRMVEEDFMEEGDPEKKDESAEDANQDMKHGEETCPPDEIMEDAHTDVGVSSEEDNLGGDHQENDETNGMDWKKDISEPGSSGLFNEQVTPFELASEANTDSLTSSENIAAVESNWSNNSQSFDNPTLSGGLPSSSMSKVDLKMSDSSNAGGFTENQVKSSFPQDEHSHVQERLPNPYRNLGDALKEWKERVKVSGDLPADNTEKPGEMEDENAEEYGFVNEVEKGTAQAMGPATSEQIDKNIDGNKLDQELHTSEKDQELKFEEHSSDIQSITNSTSIPKNEKREHINVSGSGSEKVHDDRSLKSVDSEKHSDDLVALKKSYFSEDIYQLSRLSVDDDILGKAQDAPDVPTDMKDEAAALWRRFELGTTKLSQELSEQLRLVMEPTVASKLQGDYRTGKRINMKKVIQYIASHYRKDKIWLRRTRPNKRDYQVVIAVDDSSSMSVSCCGDIVIEALVTVCRAISQLEMGSLAIASFGTKGNIKLLHDFDRPFTAEAGIRMVSNLTFEQENTIVNEPILDLLKFLIDKLDSAVAKARLPSGHNPLEQLVLIISDGQFHEKDNLKRWIRDLSTGNRMVAFLVLDNSQDSIMDRTEVSFDRNGKMKLSKYMESFPFPYYVVLRNIEALPRTLASLLRQWMELVQKSVG
ncbi:hypothetical protein QN277_022325 [Acacia crassicarpa]|uniref:Midasin n=1 Tax=Acacia crassicarpa TaxID=499986 RepID=A0AAE1JIX2_9FABA|nr:hypothetical protein QN277_022325 [Acacia crassicarpa]